QLTLVYDKGNNSRANQPLADELGLGVLGSLSPTQHPALLDVELEEFHPSLSTSGETLTIEESMTLRARTENAGHGDEHEWSWACG
ncbi:MAG TPA: hypothetical protein VEF89_30925, partial [Solirubrobacteraceae bacterium]|nr:hypothetical protein [Solirubrobacteraceae bacterium]